MLCKVMKYPKKNNVQVLAQQLDFLDAAFSSSERTNGSRTKDVSQTSREITS